MKESLKKLLPDWFVRSTLPFFHKLQSVFWNMRFGRPASGMNVIGITGTNGKTSTAAFLGKILEKNGFKIGLSTTAFYQIGSEITMNDTNMTVTDPARLYKLLKRMKDAQLDWVILEVTSHALDQFRVNGIDFKVAAVTNLTQDHLDYHASMDEYAKAKGRLFARGAPYHVLNKDDQWFDFFNEFEPTERKLTYGVDPQADCRIVAAKLGPNGSKLDIKLERASIKPNIKLIGKFNAYNALCAATIAHALTIEPKVIQEGLEELERVPGRMEVIEHSKRGIKVVIDYAHTEDALANVLETLKNVTKKRIITVFGATGNRDTSKRPLMGKTVARLSDIAIVTDDDPYTENPINIRAEVLNGCYSVVDGADIYEVGDRRAAIAKAIELAKVGDVILLAGIGHQRYRVVGTEKIEWNEPEIAKELLAKAQ